MMKKIIAAFLVIILLMPLGANTGNYKKEYTSQYKAEDFFENKNFLKDPTKSYNFNILDDPGAFIYTRCDGVEKKIPILKALLSPIDVDNNATTGVNGKDIKISAFIFPFVQEMNGSWILAISLVFKVIRIGEEIKSKDFETYVQFDLQGQTFRAGIGSESGEELPRETRLVFTVVPYVMYNREPEYYLNLEPIFDGQPSNISIFGEYIGNTHQYIQFDFKPAIESIIKFSPHLKIGNIGMEIRRFAAYETSIKMIYKGEYSANITIEDIPTKMAFNLAFSESHFEYNSNDEFNASMLIESGDTSACARIIYLPRRIVIDGGLEGYINVFINNRNTMLILADRPVNPSTFFEISNLTGNITLQWNIGSSGMLQIDGAKNAKIELYALDGIFDLKAIKKASHFSFAWALGSNGSISIDTNWEWFAEFYMNISFDRFGILIGANFMRADDYALEWEVIPPSFSKYGKIELMGNLTFAVMLDGVWYNIP